MGGKDPEKDGAFLFAENNPSAAAQFSLCHADPVFYPPDAILESDFVQCTASTPVKVPEIRFDESGVVYVALHRPGIFFHRSLNTVLTEMETLQNILFGLIMVLMTFLVIRWLRNWKHAQ
jgi:hypothetical protein